jgi:hypothetical protein
VNEEKIKFNPQTDYDVQRLLEPITAVLETVLNSQFVDQPHEIDSSILDIIKYIALSLTNSNACPCFQM